ncbi:hypothetical protein TNIN_185071 [Trichonephila inaurata madagascariensis]|uniref:Uncharacterized protein n=1 Tax=Trichonephila inaurata madagascariensis TaxID=2747483 RepID=A0A8X6YTA8_9ARAC|nr:hypothetical protein TNIN_185071 [Trichonephila inaurata madagascariensis]
MGWSRKKKDRLQYPCIPSAIQLVPHSADKPIPDPPMKVVSEKRGERYHQDIVAMEGVYQGRWDESRLPDNCWTLIRGYSDFDIQEVISKEIFTGNKLKNTTDF